MLPRNKLFFPSYSFPFSAPPFPPSPPPFLLLTPPLLFPPPPHTQNQATVSELLALGADKTLADKKGRLPIHHVRKHRPVWYLLCDEDTISPLVSEDERGKKRERRRTKKRDSFRRSSSIRTKKDIQHSHRTIPRTGMCVYVCRCRCMCVCVPLFMCICVYVYRYRSICPYVL